MILIMVVVPEQLEDREHTKPAQMTELLLQQQVEMAAGATTTRSHLKSSVPSRKTEKVLGKIFQTDYDNSVIVEGPGSITIAHPQEKPGEWAAELFLEKSEVPEDSRIPRPIQPEPDRACGLLKAERRSSQSGRTRQMNRKYAIGVITAQSGGQSQRMCLTEP